MKSSMKFMIAAVVLVALLAVPAMARGPTIKDINSTDVVFVYETGVNVADIAPDGTSNTYPTKFVKFASDQPDSTVAGGGQQLAEIVCDSPGVLSVNTVPAYMGIWFGWNKSYISPKTGNVSAAKYIQIQRADVTLDAVLNVSHTDGIAGKSVTRDTNIAFKLISNYAGNYFKTADGTYAAKVNIELTTPGGGKIQVFGYNSVPGGVGDLRAITLNGSVQYTDTLPTGSQTFVNGAIDLTNVEAGTYTATAKWTTTMPWYNLESNSNAVTFTVLSKPITITTNKESVVRGNTFVVTVTGESKKVYWVYLKDSSISAGYLYPQISPGQSFVNGTAASGWAVGSVNLTDINPVFNTTATVANQTAAAVTTAADGTRTIQFETTAKTYDTKYTVKVLDPADYPAYSKFDTVDVTVAKGQVTITYEGTGTYYLGETIKLTGTNTDSKTVYLFLVGPNLATNGVSLADITVTSKDNDVNTFKSVDVNTDNTWSFKWDTSQLTSTLDAGTYTVYAVAQPNVKNNLTNTEYNTASLVLKKPFVTASTSVNTLAKGDILYIRGTAEGKPNSVYIWTFGKNYRDCQESASVKSDASYEYKMDRGVTADLYAGEYFVVVQHPMMNGIADIVGPGGANCVWAQPAQASAKTTANGTPVRLTGLQASDAATALVELLNSPNIDDTYTKLSFMVEEPWLRIDTIGDKYVGDTFKITGTTNLAEGDQILMTVTSSSFQPTEKTQTGEFSGTSGTVTVQKGDTYNTFSFDVDASTFKPDEYLVKAESVEPSQTTTATFNVLEGKPTTVPTTERTPVITIPETPIRTTVATTVVPTTTAKPQPGFGALVALVGLGAVALLVLRRH
jgi:PGF-CTERM protein